MAFKNHEKVVQFCENATVPLVLMSDDTGLEIEGLGGEPGVRVRRWKGYSMTDEEIISHCLDRMKHLNHQDQRNAKFTSVVALITVPCKSNGSDKSLDHTETAITFTGTLEGRIMPAADPIRIKGFPMESIFWVDKWKALLGHVTDLSEEEKAKRNIYTHREEALQLAIESLKKLL